MSLGKFCLVSLCLAAFAGFSAAQTGDDSFQVNYATNLNVGDSFINITNLGVTPTSLAPAAGSTANICVNVYTFDSAEELISCCSCLVTSNALVSLSARRDLISNTLTPATPSAIVVKLLSTQPTVAAASGGSVTQTCNPAIDPLPMPPWTTSSTLAHGMRAWSTTLKALGSGSYVPVESRFSWLALTDSEVFRTTRLCGFIQNNGSGFGLCKTCRTGALGAVHE